jgi:glyoxylase-like metal-dependent hydrolase (beta-lactamase superfamily II)
MQRRIFLRNTGVLLGTSLLAQKNLMAQLLQQPPFKIKMLNDTIGVFSEKGGTIAFLLAKKEIVVVDAQFPEQSKHLIDELKKKSENPFSLLINTHHHGDHTSGNISFKGIVTHVLAHENSKINQGTVAKTRKNEDQQLYPDQVYKESWCEKFGKEKICLYYYGAGHTNGDSLVHFEHSNIVHMGDLMFNRRHPFIDRSAGASIKNWQVVLETAVKKFDNNTQYIFGHAAEGNEVTGMADDLKKFNDYLGNLLKFVDGEIRAGKTKDEILKATEIPGSPEWKGDGIQRPLTAAYEELTSK